MKTKFGLSKLLFMWCAIFLLGLSSQASAAVEVWGQPSGSDIQSAYALVGETRTYFGRASMTASDTYEAMWEFSDGTLIPYAPIGNRRYITTTHTFLVSGLNWARLSVRDPLNPADVASVTIQVMTLAADSTNRQKNSAIDNGLRKHYTDVNWDPVTGMSWGSWNQVGQTGMALIAFENHGHSLESPDTDIYKVMVVEGLRWLFNNAHTKTIGLQGCIGDPEGVPGDPDFDDGDIDNDQLGIYISLDAGSTDGYEPSIAMLAIVNSCTLATAQTTTVTQGPLAGMTLFDVMVDMKDWLAWAQTDYEGTSGSGGEGEYDELPCGPSNTEWAYGSTSDPDVFTKFYTPFMEFHGGWSTRVDLSTPIVLHLIDEDVYIDIMFTSWSCCGNGGFAYTRTTEGVPGEKIWTGGSMTFTKPDGADYLLPVNQDLIVPGTAITRMSNGGIFNIIREDSHDESYCDTTEPPYVALDCDMAGWRYRANDSSIDNSVAQWPTLALEEARDRWGINVNPQVIEVFKGWLAYSQDASGGLGYSSPGNWVNFPKTGAGLAMFKWVGYDATHPDVVSALNYLDSQWDVPCGDGNLGHLYGMYAFYKGMKFLGLDLLDGRLWENLYADYLIANQNADGSWNTCGGWIPSPMTTGTALAMLAPAVAGLPPVALAGGPYGPVNANQLVMLVGSGSFHQDATKNLIDYKWDFDAADGLWWDSAPFPTPGQGAIGVDVPTSYPDTGSDGLYTVTLMVTDDSVPTMSDMATSTVEVTSGNVAPVASTNGPWAGAPNVMLTFDGTSSFDPNSCVTPGDPSCLGDSIVLYEWDIDGDGAFNEVNGDDGTPVTPGDLSVVQRSFPAPTSSLVTLRVTDSFGLTNTVTNEILSIALVFAEDYSYCYRIRTGRTTARDGILVQFVNQGTGVAENLVVTLTSVPTNRTIDSGVSVLGTMGPGDIGTTWCDASIPDADIESTVNLRLPENGVWAWQAEFDFNGQHYIIPNLPALAP
ncbi:MAG: hypothetical protein GY797_01755 [Deltaproteobacteria bacterium]|nr:hypothetical protein [Deltaproteobacteria bacterium]